MPALGGGGSTKWAMACIPVSLYPLAYVGHQQRAGWKTEALRCQSVLLWDASVVGCSLTAMPWYQLQVILCCSSPCKNTRVLRWVWFSPWDSLWLWSASFRMNVDLGKAESQLSRNTMVLVTFVCKLAYSPRPYHDFNVLSLCFSSVFSNYRDFFNRVSLHHSYSPIEVDL